MKTLWHRLQQLWTGPPLPRKPPLPEGDERLIQAFEVLADVLCPCGSQIIHQLTLASTTDCPRCGRTIAIRAIEYARVGPIPEPVITVGFVERIRFTSRRGVH